MNIAKSRNGRLRIFTCEAKINMDARGESVYILFHVNPNTDSQKLIGVYSTKDRASKTIQKYGSIPGFRDFPDGYIIDEYRLDQDGWAEGFGDP